MDYHLSGICTICQQTLWTTPPDDCGARRKKEIGCRVIRKDLGWSELEYGYWYVYGANSSKHQKWYCQNNNRQFLYYGTNRAYLIGDYADGLCRKLFRLRITISILRHTHCYSHRYGRRLEIGAWKNKATIAIRPWKMGKKTDSYSFRIYQSRRGQT